MNATTLAPAALHTKEEHVSGTRWLAAIVLAALWLEVVSRLRFEWSVNPQYGYGWTVPLLAAFLFWRRWQTAPAPDTAVLRPLIAICALIAAMLFVPVRLIQEANPDWRLMSWIMAGAAVVASASLAFIAGGAKWLRYFAFPILFFCVAVPWPTQLEQFVIQGLMRADAAINVEVLNAIGIAAVQHGNVIEVGSGFVGIDEACTGIRSLQATFMVSLFLGELYGFTALRRAVLVASGAALAFLCNLVRTFLLVWLGAEHGSQAIKSWHDPAGMTILIACLFGLWIASMLLQRGNPPNEQFAAQPRHLRLSPALLVAFLAIVVSAEAGTQLWYRSHEAESQRLKPWNVAWPNESSGWREVPVAESAQELLRYNEGGGGMWNGPDGHRWNMYFFRWRPGRTAGLFVKTHRPDVCLPASGMSLQSSARNRVFKINGVTLPIRAYVFENGPEKLHVYYCYWDGTAPKLNDDDHEDWTAAGRLEAVKRGKRDIGTQMLELVAWGYNDDAPAETAAREQLSRIIKPG